MEYASNCLEQWWFYAPDSVPAQALNDIQGVVNLLVSVRYGCEAYVEKSFPERRKPRLQPVIPDLRTTVEKYIVIDVLRLLKEQCHEAFLNPNGPLFAFDTAAEAVMSTPLPGSRLQGRLPPGSAALQ